MNYWSGADAANWILLLCFHWWGETCYSSRSVYAPAPILFSLGVHSMEERLISHSNISVGNGEMAEMHAEATPFISASGKTNTGTVDGNIWHFLHRDTSHLQIDALSEIDRRRCNECDLVTQRHATRTLWVLSSAACWLVCFFFFFKAKQKASCLCYSSLERVGENVSRDNSSDAIIHF